VKVDRIGFTWYKQNSPKKKPEEKKMVEPWIFYVLRSAKDEHRGRVIREYLDPYDSKVTLPVGAVVHFIEDVDLADLDQWRTINNKIAREAHRHGIFILDNLDPDPDTGLAIAKALEQRS
jgi:hypothetical protein